MTEADQHDSNGETADGNQNNGDETKDSDLHERVAANTEADQNIPLVAEQPAYQQDVSVETPKPAANRILVYGVMGIGIGILAGVVIAATTWHLNQPTPPPEPVTTPEPSVSHELRDLGLDDSSTAGLKGHLTTQWNEKPGYRLVIEPSDPAQQAGFALTVSDPPRPLSIGIQLKDAGGAVLCSQNILLKFDARKAAALAGPSPGKPAWKQDAPKAANYAEYKRNQEAEFDRLDAQEQERERGKDIFHNDIGQDGQIESISAQGELPCSKAAYTSAVVWSFEPDFPTLDEQAELLNRQAGTQAMAERTFAQQYAARKRAAYKSASTTISFSIEGDDAIVEFDSAGGTIETMGGKSFFIDKTSKDATTIKEDDLPLRIHYRCDQTSACALTHAGSVVLHAKLKR